MVNRLISYAKRYGVAVLAGAALGVYFSNKAALDFVPRAAR